ncbi:dNA polymerase III delta' subunit [Brachyspira sp. CAG:484]|nr:dNA polymerase III delta' subunit [Brachyspira sp. CAG:484]
MLSLDSKYPFLMKYFSKGVENPDKSIAHCILFYGTDIQAQYDLALEIARMLNCTGDHTPECDCLNCRWIRENSHPAVMTISKVDNKPANDDSKQVISIDQARMIKNDLLVTSDYHRVLIFCDKDKEGNVCGLNEYNFQEPTANALLKTFEEPPAKTTFFFLTNDKTDMISTIVSRAQCFFVPSFQDEDRDFSLVKDAMDGYLSLERNNVLDLNDSILSLAKDNDALLIFNQMQNYMTELLKSNLQNRIIKIKLLHDINSVEKAKRELKLNMNIQTIVENLCFDLIL